MILATDHGATGDGQTDDTAALQAALTAAAGGHLHIPAGTYLVNPAITAGAWGLRPASHTRITLDPSAILQCTTQTLTSFRMVTLVEVSSVTISGGQIVGDKIAHGPGNHGHGIAVTDCEDVTIEAVSLSDHYGDCIYLSGTDPAKAGNRHITIRDCTLTNSSRQGISITRAEGVLVESCQITDISGGSVEYGIDVETNVPTLPCNNVTIRGCYFAGSVGGGVTATGHTTDLRVLDSQFDGNLCRVGGTGTTVRGCTFSATSVTLSGDASGLTFAANTLRGSGVLLYVGGTRIDGLNLTGNTFTNPDALVGLAYIRSNGAGVITGAITGNVLDGHTATTQIDMLNGCRFAGNTIRSTAPVIALALTGADVDVSDNLVAVAATGALDAAVAVSFIRGRVGGNYFATSGLTLAKGVLRLGGRGEAVGPAVTGNVIHNRDGGACVYTYAPSYGAQMLISDNVFGASATPVTGSANHSLSNSSYTP